MSDAERMILIQRMILGAHHFHGSLSPVIPSQTGITLMIVMMTNFLTCHGRYNRYTVSCMKSVTLTCRWPLFDHVTSAECVCCREISAVVAKIGELGDTSVVCITLHPGFASVCLNVSLQWNLSNPEH